MALNHGIGVRIPASQPSPVTKMRTRIIAVLFILAAALAVAAKMSDFHRMKSAVVRLSGETPGPCAFRTKYGIPCLGCGGTHAFHQASRGRLAAAFRAHPAGAMLGLVAWGTIVAGGASFATGRARYLAGAVLGGLVLVALAFVIHGIAWWRALPPGIPHG